MNRKRRVVKRKVTTQNAAKIIHTPRLISILDNLVATTITAFFVGIAAPQCCGANSNIDWGIETLLALFTFMLYAFGMFIQKGMKDE